MSTFWNFQIWSKLLLPWTLLQITQLKLESCNRFFLKHSNWDAFSSPWCAFFLAAMSDKLNLLNYRCAPVSLCLEGTDSNIFKICSRDNPGTFILPMCLSTHSASQIPLQAPDAVLKANTLRSLCIDFWVKSFQLCHSLAVTLGKLLNLLVS